MNARTNIMGLLWLALFAMEGVPALAGSPNVSPGADVAPGVEGTRFQAWPRAAWAAESKVWLVVWREGDLTEQETDIWCARVGPDGKALDPAGIRVTGAKGVQDRPVVASDGKDFLVAWSDFRNGKDWDVYAARVAGDPAKAGQSAVLDADGFPVAIGDHSQCQPTAAFVHSTSSRLRSDTPAEIGAGTAGQAGGNYLVAWQGWVEDGVQKGYGGYEIRGARVSPAGKALDPGEKRLVGVSSVQPSLVPDGDGTALLAWYGCAKPKYSSAGRFSIGPGVARIDASSMATQGPTVYLELEKSSIGIDGNAVSPSVVWVADKGGLMTVAGYKGGTTIYGFDNNRRKAGECLKIHTYTAFDLIVASSLAFDGSRVLFTQDWEQKTKKGKQPGVGVFGWILAPDGKVVDGGADGFAIAVDPSKDNLQGYACAGPAGTFLVVSAEARAVENTKVVARLVE